MQCCEASEIFRLKLASPSNKITLCKLGPYKRGPVERCILLIIHLVDVHAFAQVVLDHVRGVSLGCQMHHTVALLALNIVIASMLFKQSYHFNLASERRKVQCIEALFTVAQLIDHFSHIPLSGGLILLYLAVRVEQVLDEYFDRFEAASPCCHLKQTVALMVF